LLAGRHYTILLIGGTLLLGGYALFEIASSGMQVTWRQTEVIFMDEVSIQPEDSFSISPSIEENVMVLIDLQSIPHDNPAELQINDEKGLSVLDIEFQKKLVTTFITKSSGPYKIMISNLGKEQALMKIEFKDVPFVNQSELFGFNNLNQIKTGLILMVAGIGGLGLGTWVFFRNRKKIT